VFPRRGHASTRTHRRERVTRPGKLYCLFLQGFVHPLISDTFSQVSGTGSSDSRTAEKRAPQRAFSRKSASAEGKNGNTDFTLAAYRVTSQLPCRRSNYAFPYPSHLSITLVYRHEGARFCMRRRALVYRKHPVFTDNSWLGKYPFFFATLCAEITVSMGFS
jgi:hypothetical protein